MRNLWLALLIFVCLPSVPGAEKAARSMADLPKGVAETPVKDALDKAARAETAPQQNSPVSVEEARSAAEIQREFVKRAIVREAGLNRETKGRRIEPPVVRVLSGPQTVETERHSQVLKVENPKVAPGAVTWKKDFAAACEAAKVSGKAVLVFQLLGRLDNEFC